MNLRIRTLNTVSLEVAEKCLPLASSFTALTANFIAINRGRCDLSIFTAFDTFFGRSRMSNFLNTNFKIINWPLFIKKLIAVPNIHILVTEIVLNNHPVVHPTFLGAGIFSGSFNASC